MPTDFARIVSYVGLIVMNQLEDSQIQMLTNLAHSEEVEGRAWARLQTSFTFNSVAIYTTGTIAVTTDSPLVVGTSTVWTPSMTGMLFRAGIQGSSGSAVQLVPIPIDSVQDATHLTLRAPYPKGSGTGLGYQIFPEFYEIQGVQRVISIKQQIPLRRTTRQSIDLIDPYRNQSSSPATQWYPFGQSTNGNAIISLWPAEVANNPYGVYGVKEHIDLQNPHDLPLLPAGVVINKTIMKALEALYALTGDQKWIAIMEHYETRYQDQWQKAIDADREEFGVPTQIQDTVGNPDFGGSKPGLDAIWNRDQGGEF